jgi:hypothetical protein
MQTVGVMVDTWGAYKIEPATRLSINRQLARRNSSLPTRYFAAILSSVSPAWTIFCTQPDGGMHEVGGMGVLVCVGVTLGVGDSSPIVGVCVGGTVIVTVIGAGERGMALAAVGVTCGANSTSEMDNAPTINPTEINAITSALPNPRKP